MFMNSPAGNLFPAHPVTVFRLVPAALTALVWRDKVIEHAALRANRSERVNIATLRQQHGRLTGTEYLPGDTLQRGLARIRVV